MRLTQGTFSYLPDLTDEQIQAQVQYCLDNDWPVAVEYTDDPHPRNIYWTMWGLPMFDLLDAAGVMHEINACRHAFPNHYIRVTGYDRRLGRQTTALSFIVNRPAEEPGFYLERQEGADRQVRYTLRAYAAVRPSGQRYG
ncbi:MAG: ribulose bisphosphate carboxylase small subunit [Anaerolineae bacterium]|nr:ribulose bisphosphate carboxylase small subunit [Anaerolineae bacterium]